MIDEVAAPSLRRRVEAKSTQELLNIWRTEYRHEWSDEEFAMVGRVLAERGELSASETTVGSSAQTTTFVDNIAKALVGIDMEVTNRRTQALVFFVSLIAFLLAGWFVTRDNRAAMWQWVVVLPLALLLHETGHYIMMRRFGYRNVRMFFIPLFGAAVSGRGAPSVFRSSIVFLAGPLPGIALGYVLGILWLVTGMDALRGVATLLIAVNALNLLPVYPLDGGQFLYELLPLRTRRYQWALQLTFALAGFAFALTLLELGSGWLGSVVSIALGGTFWLRQRNKWRGIVADATDALPNMDAKDIPRPILADLTRAILVETTGSKPSAVAEIIWSAWNQLRAERPTNREMKLLASIYGVAWLSLALWFVVAR